MFYLGFTEVYNHWKRSLLMALQVALLMLLTVSLVTTYWTQSEKYRPFQEFLSGKGIIVVPYSGYGNAGGIDKYLEGFQKLKGYQYVAKSYVTITEGTGRLEVYGYDELTSSYIPPMAEGEWYTEAKQGDYINVVVSYNPYGLKAGDDVSFTYVDREFTFHICGVMADGASAYQANENIKEPSFFDFFHMYGSEDISYPEYALFMSMEDMASIEMDFVQGRSMIAFEDDITYDELEANKEYAEKIGVTFMYSFDDIREATEPIIKNKVYEILPTALSAFVLITFGVACLVSVDTLVNLKSYAVYYTCGMRWRQCLGVSAVQSLITGVLGFLLMVLLGNTVLIGYEDNLFLFELGGVQLLACGFILLYIVVLSAVIPYFILRRNQPVDVLRDAKL